MSTSELSTLLGIEQNCWKLGMSLRSSSRDYEPVLPHAGQLLGCVYR